GAAAPSCPCPPSTASPGWRSRPRPRAGCGCFRPRGGRGGTTRASAASPDSSPPGAVKWRFPRIRKPRTMKILVGYKRVVDFNVRIQVKPDGSGVVTDGVKLSANPFDEIALEEALRLRDKGIASEVVVAT